MDYNSDDGNPEQSGLLRRTCTHKTVACEHKINIVLSQHSDIESGIIS